MRSLQGRDVITAVRNQRPQSEAKSQRLQVRGQSSGGGYRYYGSERIELIWNQRMELSRGYRSVWSGARDQRLKNEGRNMLSVRSETWADITGQRL